MTAAAQRLTIALAQMTQSVGDLDGNAAAILAMRDAATGADLDVVAALSMLAALVFAEYLAAAVVAVMYSGGQYLESFAERRASREPFPARHNDSAERSQQRASDALYGCEYGCDGH